MNQTAKTCLIIVAIILFPISVPVFIAGSILTTGKTRKIQLAMQKLAIEPTQEAATAAVSACLSCNRMHKFYISGNDYLVQERAQWRDSFNRSVIPSSAISDETKAALRKSLIEFNVTRLLEVKHIPTAEEVKVAQERFGQLGEQNAWFNLKHLYNCDLYYDVNIAVEKQRNCNGVTQVAVEKSQIDAIVVSPEYGIFLLEIKSEGGVRGEDQLKHITPAMAQSHGQQMGRHSGVFKDFIAAQKLNVQDKVKNVLVFSWPVGEESRYVDPGANMPSYDVISLNQLMGYFSDNAVGTLTPEERQQLATTLAPYSREYICST